jgi:ATP-dependent Clp protease ATP-binding subunit ClpB
LELTDKAKEYVAERGYDPAYGARPIKRTLQRLVADPLSLAILEGRFTDGDTIRVDLNSDGLKFVKANEIVERELAH